MVEDWHLVEEALQETAVYMCNHWKDFTHGTNFTAWARTVALMRCRELLQKERKQDKIKSSVSESVLESVWNNYGSYYVDKKQMLADCIKELPEKQQMLLRMRYTEKKPCNAIARALKKRIDSIYMVMSRIRQTLRKCIDNKIPGKTA